MWASGTAEEIPMDAYTTCMLRLTEATLAERRRDAARYAVSRLARRRRGRLRTGFRPSVIPMPQPAPVAEAEVDLRSA